MKFYLFAFWIQFFTILASFIISIVLNKYLKQINYLKHFYIYNSLAFLGILSIVINTYVLNRKYHFELSIFSKILLLFHFFFLGYKIVQILTIHSIKKIAFGVYLLLGIIVFIITSLNIADGKGVYSFASANLGLVMLNTIYYFEIFQLSPEKKLQNIPSFWLVNGMFLSMSLSIPCVLFEYYVKKNYESYNYLIIIGIGCLSYVILHLFLIKSFYCAKNYNKYQANSAQ